MKPVYIVADNIFSPLGPDTSTNLEKVMEGVSGIRKINAPVLSPVPFYASAFGQFPEPEQQRQYTRFEELCIASIRQALRQTEIRLGDKETIFILSSTKGNIEFLEFKEINEQVKNQISLFQTAKTIAGYFNYANQPVVICNACISGVAAIITARRLLESGKYKNAVITGADIISRFVLSGFQCLNAISDEPCKPFDRNRKGINLGECAATIVLTTTALNTGSRQLLVNGGAITNDANHISGPSRTGLELSIAINTSMKESSISLSDISFVSAHGTATIYNDEMEGKAFVLSGIADIPLHSLKGNYGHTLGAAGILESILTYRSLEKGIILPSKNFEEPGLTESINVNTSLKTSSKQYALKTASGFGGCNAAIIYSLN